MGEGSAYVSRVGFVDCFVPRGIGGKEPLIPQRKAMPDMLKTWSPRVGGE